MVSFCPGRERPFGIESRDSTLDGWIRLQLVSFATTSQNEALNTAAAAPGDRQPDSSSPERLTHAKIGHIPIGPGAPTTCPLKQPADLDRLSLLFLLFTPCCAISAAVVASPCQNAEFTGAYLKLPTRQLTCCLVYSSV